LYYNNYFINKQKKKLIKTVINLLSLRVTLEQKKEHQE